MQLKGNLAVAELRLNALHAPKEDSSKAEEIAIGAIVLAVISILMNFITLCSMVGQKKAVGKYATEL